jgi:hypothetical protein
MFAHEKFCAIALSLIFFTFSGCSGLTYEQLVPDKGVPAFQSNFKANVIVAGGPQDCIRDRGDQFTVTPQMFKKALIQSAGQALTEQDAAQEFTLIVKNFDCCFGGEAIETTCRGNSFWALRNNPSQHIVWQKHINGTGAGTFHINGANRIKEAIANCMQHTIASGLSDLSQLDLAAGQAQLAMLAQQWHQHRSAERFSALFQYLLFSSDKKIIRDRDGVHTEFNGNLLISFTKQYVADLMGNPDNMMTAPRGNQTFEWSFNNHGKETVYRLSFYQDRLSGGTLKQPV